MSEEKPELQFLRYTIGEIEVNCYFVINQETKELIVIDPGDAVPSLQEQIEQMGLKPVAVLLTHAHYDHAHGVKSFKEIYPVPVYVHEAEKKTLTDPLLNASYNFGYMEGYEADVFLTDDEEIDLAGIHIKVIFTPGHTPGGCCYYLPDYNTLFCGDTLFKGSVGRTDLAGGKSRQLIQSIRKRLLTLPPETVIYPGHGDYSTIGEEIKSNPFCNSW